MQKRVLEKFSSRIIEIVSATSDIKKVDSSIEDTIASSIEASMHKKEDEKKDIQITPEISIVDTEDSIDVEISNLP